MLVKLSHKLLQENIHIHIWQILVKFLKLSDYLEKFLSRCLFVYLRKPVNIFKIGQIFFE